MKKKKSSTTIDVLSHDLVPEMKVLSDNEKSKVLSKYQIDEDQFPKVSSKDSAVVALKATVGNVLEIKRDDGTGKYTTYRIVVE
ncbi:MAG: DNA-directed RNA polymerase subunit RpoH/Rpb5 C-terminal domain-containing protein [Candidatus Micrarchaeota archaeon]